MNCRSGVRPGFAPPAALEALLQAILAPDPLATRGFEAWRNATQFDSLPEAHFRLLGELAQVIDRLAPDWPEKPRVLGIQKYCWSNNIHIIRTVLPIIDQLIAADIRFVLLKGGGIIARDPAAMHWRMLRDIDLLVATTDVAAAAEILLTAGWRPVTGRLPGVLRAQPFDRLGPANPHAPSRIEIDLHHRVLHPGRYGEFDSDFIERSQVGNLLNREVRSPHVVDQALTALSQALMFSQHPNYVWIGDAVRAMRAPDFAWPEFWDRVIQRDILFHARAVVGYLEKTFGVPVGDVPEAARRQGAWKKTIHAAEISAMGRSRAQRGLSGRLAMLIAESLRTRAIPARVGFRTNYIVAMNPTRASAIVLGQQGEGFVWDAAPADRRGVSIQVQFPEPLMQRVDLDLWSGERWMRRLKLKPGLLSRTTSIWKTSLSDIEASAIDTLRIELASSSDNGDQ